MRLNHPACVFALALSLAVGIGAAAQVRADETPATGTVTGKVLDANGQPAKGVKVAAFAPGTLAERKNKTPGTATDAPTTRPRPEALAKGVTGDDGTYTLTDVPAGKVRIVAGAKGSGFGVSKAIVTVTAGQTTKVEDIKLRTGTRKSGAGLP